MPSSHFILGPPLLLLSPSPPSIRVFSNESTVHIRWPKYWSLSFTIIHSREIRGLISFRMDWLDLLAVQATLKSLLQHHSSKTSIRIFNRKDILQQKLELKYAFLPVYIIYECIRITLKERIKMSSKFKWIRWSTKHEFLKYDFSSYLMEGE